MATRTLVLMASSFLFACASSAPTDAPASVQQASACAVYHAQPDPRDCVFPLCGGYFMHLVATPANLECTPLPDYNDPYVTGIFERDEAGNLVQVYPACEYPLTGAFEPDPEHRSFFIFVDYACV